MAILVLMSWTNHASSRCPAVLNPIIDEPGVSGMRFVHALRPGFSASTAMTRCIGAFHVVRRNKVCPPNTPSKTRSNVGDQGLKACAGGAIEKVNAGRHVEAGAEEFSIGFDGRAEAMLTQPCSSGVAQRIEHAALVRHEKGAAIDAAGKSVRQQPSGIDVEEQDLLLVLSANATPPGHDTSVRCDTHDCSGYGSVGTERRRIDEDPLRTVQAITEDDGCLILVCALPAEEVASTPHDRRRLRVRPRQRLELAPQQIAAGDSSRTARVYAFCASIHWRVAALSWSSSQR